MGRPPKPAALKKAKGTHRKSRDAPQTALLPDKLKSKDFEFTSVLKTYNLLVKVAEKTGVFSTQYSFSLRVLAQDLVYMAKLVSIVNKGLKNNRGFSYEVVGTNGETLKKPDPDAEHLRKVITSVRKGLAEFGWNPSDSARIAKEENDAASQMFAAIEKLMFGDDIEDDLD